MPSDYGCWLTVYKRHNRWAKDGTWAVVLDQLCTGCDEAEGRDWTGVRTPGVMRAHQYAAGAQHPPVTDEVSGGKVE